MKMQQISNWRGKKKAVRMYAPRDLRVEEVDIPSYEADECLIKVMAVGVCGSDIPRVNQYGAHVSPIIVGHEFGGQIVKTGDKVTKFKAGDRVTCPPLIPCFKCKYCEMVNIHFVKTTIIMVQEEMVHLHNISQ